MCQRERAAFGMLVRMPISIFDSGTIPHERRAELEAAVVAAGRRLHQRYEGWIVAIPDCRKFAVRIASYPEVDVSVPFDWHTTAAEATERVGVAMEIDAHGSHRAKRRIFQGAVRSDPRSQFQLSFKTSLKIDFQAGFVFHPMVVDLRSVFLEMRVKVSFQD